jgi:hypothetical protein
VGPLTKERMAEAAKITPDSLELIKKARAEVKAAVAVLLDGSTVLAMPTAGGLLIAGTLPTSNILPLQLARLYEHSR